MNNPFPLRPIYFNAVVWGAKFCDYLTDYCIPALLSDNNIPALSNESGQNKFLICCPVDEWNYLINHKTIVKLSEYLEPVHLEIPYPPNNATTPCLHMGVGHKMATARCYQDKAYFVALTPDMMLSDGTIAAMEKYARMGKQIVYSGGLRFCEEEGLIEYLCQIGYDPTKNSYSKIQFSGAELVSMIIKYPHRAMSFIDIGLPYLEDNVAAYLKFIEDEGFLLHSFNWFPLLLDHGAIERHDVSTFEQGTFDSDYVYKNFGTNPNMYICQDSDEIMLVTWTPRYEHYDPLIKQPLTKYEFTKKIYYSYLMEKSFYDEKIDDLKKKLILIPLYFHQRKMQSSKWESEERYFQSALHKQSLHHLNNNSYATTNLLKIIMLGFLPVSKKCRNGYNKLYYSENYIISMLIRFLISALFGGKVATNELKSHPKYGGLFRILLFFRKASL